MSAASNETVRLDVLDVIEDIRSPPITLRKDIRSWFAFLILDAEIL